MGIVGGCRTQDGKDRGIYFEFNPLKVQLLSTEYVGYLLSLLPCRRRDNSSRDFEPHHITLELRSQIFRITRIPNLTGRNLVDDESWWHSVRRLVQTVKGGGGPSISKILPDKVAENK